MFKDPLSSFSSLISYFSFVALALLFFGAGNALAQTGGVTAPVQPALTDIQHAVQLRAGETLTGALAATQPMHVIISLKLRNQAELSAFLANPLHASLTPAEFTAEYSPTTAQVEAVVAFMRAAGFAGITIAPNRLLVSGDAPTSTVAAAFRTSFVQVLTLHGRHAFANASDVYIPTSLQSTVTSVLGLQNVHIFHTAPIAYAPSASGSMLQPQQDGGSLVGHDPTNFPIIYDDSSLAPASSVTVGIVTVGSMVSILSDLQQFTSHNGLPTVNVTVDCVISTGCGGDAGTDIEWDLDSQDIVAMGGVQNLVLYDTASFNDADLTTDYNTIVSADAVKVINVSLAQCETTAQSSGTTSADDPIFEEADAQNQTFSFAAGDNGADECKNSTLTPSYAASSPYVVAVGGTDLYTTGTTQWADETVWPGTGGSPSTFEPMESWQVDLGPNANSSFRGVSDIAFDADPDSGAEIWIDGSSPTSHPPVGGTSLASPLFVGTWARILQAKGQNLGFAAPLVYMVASASNEYTADLHDITSGTNDGENTLVGWDYPTGLGSIVGSEFLSGLNTSLSVSPPGGFDFNELSCVGRIDHYSVMWSPGAGPTPSEYMLYSELGSGSWGEAYEGSMPSDSLNLDSDEHYNFRLRADVGGVWSSYGVASLLTQNCNSCLGGEVAKLNPQICRDVTPPELVSAESSIKPQMR